MADKMTHIENAQQMLGVYYAKDAESFYDDPHNAADPRVDKAVDLLEIIAEALIGVGKEIERANDQ